MFCYFHLVSLSKSRNIYYNKILIYETTYYLSSHSSALPLSATMQKSDDYEYAKVIRVKIQFRQLLAEINLFASTFGKNKFIFVYQASAIINKSINSIRLHEYNSTQFNE